jgi:hypothetical protein
MGIRRCLNDGATQEQVAIVLRWMAASQHTTAVFLRERGLVRSETPWRPSKFEAYLGFATLRAPSGGAYKRRAGDVLPEVKSADDGEVF